MSSNRKRLRRVLTLFVVLTVLLGLSSAVPGGATPSRTASGPTLAQRRTAVAKDLATVHGVRTAGHATPATGRPRTTPSRSNLTDDAHWLPSQVVKDNTPKGAAQQPRSASTAGPWGVVTDMALGGPVGLSTWNYDPTVDLTPGMPVPPGYTPLSGAQFSNGIALPGETLTAYAEIYNSANPGCTITGQNSVSCPNEPHQVHVTWEVTCQATFTEQTYDFNQVVTAPSSDTDGEDSWGMQATGLQPGPVVTAQLPISASWCPNAVLSGGGVWTYLRVDAIATVTDVANNTDASGDWDLFEGGGGVPPSAIQGCPCGSDSSGTNETQQMQGDAVDTATGAYVDSFTDADLKAPGVPLAVTRNYSSQVTAAGPLGKGWSAPWFASLTIGSSTVTVNSANGSRYPYQSNGGGTYTAPIGPRSVLVKTSSGTYTLTTPQQTVLTFNTGGQLVSDVDATGRGLSFTYTGTQLTGVTDASGHTATLSYTGSLVTAVALPGGATVTYAYTNGSLTSATDPDGRTTSYSYGPSGLLTSVQKPDGTVVITTAYDSSGRVTSQQDSTGATTNFSYTTTSTGLEETDTTDPDGGIWTDVYGGNQLLETVDPLGNSVYRNYDKLLDVIQSIDPTGQSTWMTYNSRGDLLTLTDPLGHVRQWAYDTKNNVTSYKDAVGNSATLTYSSLNEIASVSTPAGGKTSFGYDATGDLTSVVDARGNVSGATASAFTTNYAYNTIGQLTSVTDPNGNATSYTYDAAGYPLTITDALGHQNTYGYDADEYLTSVSAPDHGVTTYAFDANGNLTSRADADGNGWSYTYDGDGRLVKETDPLGESVTAGYDGDGNQTTATDARGITATTTYDADNRPTKVTYSDSTPTVVLGYDNDSDVTGITDATGTRAFGYDAAGRLTSITGPGSSGFTYGYDADGNVTSRTYPDGTSATYTYSPDEVVASMTSHGSVTTYKHDVAGNLTSAVEPNGVTESRTYDNAGQLTAIKDATSSKTLDSDTLTLNADGQPSQVAVTANGTAKPTWFYGYDTNGRLTSACSQTAQSSCSTASGGGQTVWTYDTAGNMLSSKANGATTAYSYNADEELTSAVTGTATTTYGYDADGDRTQAGGTTYGWNAAGQMSQAVTPSGTYTYTYDSGGNVSSASLNGTLKQTAVWDINNPDSTLAEQTGPTGASTGDFLYRPSGALAAMTTSAGTYQATTDWLGSVTGLTSSTGAQVTTTSYTPYGTATTTGSPTSPLGYAGSYAQPGTGLDDMRARDYDPSTGGFTSVDPMVTVSGQPYAYASDAPNVYTDPTGRLVGFDNVVAGLIGAVVAGGGALLNDWMYGKSIKWSDVAIAATGGFAYGFFADECGLCAGPIYGAWMGAATDAVTQINDNRSLNINPLSVVGSAVVGGAMGSLDDYMGTGGGEHVAENSSEAVKAGIWTAPQDLASGMLDPVHTYSNLQSAYCSIQDGGTGGLIGGLMH